MIESALIAINMVKAANDAWLHHPDEVWPECRFDVLDRLDYLDQMCVSTIAEGVERQFMEANAYQDLITIELGGC